MARIPEALRLAIIDGHITHWTEAEVVNGPAFTLLVVLCQPSRPGN